MRSQSHRLVLSLLVFVTACGGQTASDIGQTSPGTGGAGGGAAGATTGAGGSVVATGAGGSTATTGAGGSGSSTGGSGTAGGGVVAGKGGGPGGQGAGGNGGGGASGSGGSGGASGSGGSGGFPACCGPTAPCPSGYSCVDTICVPPPPPGQCWSDLDCQFPGPGTWQCVGGKVCPCNADCSFSEVLGTCEMAAGGCPTSLPQQGTSCAPDGLACTFGSACCGPEAFCMNGTWFIAAPNCPVPQGCPPSPPADGDACCGFQPSCAWDECNTVGQIQASCDNGTGKWTVSTTPCDNAGPICGGKPCNPSEICVEYQGGAGITYSCQADPCGSSPLSCGCAASLCAPPQSCLVADSKHLTCTCDLCP